MQDSSIYEVFEMTFWGFCYKNGKKHDKNQRNARLKFDIISGIPMQSGL